MRRNPQKIKMEICVKGLGDAHQSSSGSNAGLPNGQPRKKQKTSKGEREHRNVFINRLLEAIRQDASKINFVPHMLTSSRWFLIMAIRTNFRVIFNIASSYWDDPVIIFEAARQDLRCLDLASLNLMSNKSFLLEVIKSNPRAIVYADKSLILEVVRSNPRAIVYAPICLRNDKDIMMEVVKKDPTAILIMSKELKNDFDIMLVAVKKDPRAIMYASKC